MPKTAALDRWIATTPTQPWKTMSPVPPGPRGAATLRLTGEVQQAWEGFGGCFNELGWQALAALPAAARAPLLADLFDPGQGLRFTLARLPIGASDYATSWYSCNETPGDFSMQHFSIARDRATLLPYIKLALKYQPDLTLFASPWSPPTWFKAPPVYNYGRFIWEKRYLAAYALYFVYPATLLILLYRSGDLVRFRELGLALGLCLYLGLLGYVLVPAVGPRYAFGDAFVHPLVGPFLTEPAARAWNAIERVDRDCFPSLHTALTTLALIYFVRLRRVLPGGRVLLAIIVLPIVLLWASTLYLRYHYGVDVLAGFALAFFVSWLAPRIQARYRMFMLRRSQHLAGRAPVLDRGGWRRRRRAVRATAARRRAAPRSRPPAARRAPRPSGRGARASGWCRR